MKKAILILFMIISCFNAKCAWSDICYEIKENAIARAEEILKHQKEIYQTSAGRTPRSMYRQNGIQRRRHHHYENKYRRHGYM